MESSSNKEQSAVSNLPVQEDIVIPDECGDSLWDPVLAQYDWASIPAKINGNDKIILEEVNSEIQAIPKFVKVMPDTQ